MSHQGNDIIKEQIMEEVTSMSVDEFQTALEKSPYGGSYSSALDDMINFLINDRWDNYPEGGS